jgi:general secretion pathway protein B
MSYILDALKKADAERERGAVPGLHAQPLPLEPDEVPTGLSPATVTKIVAGVAVTAVLILSWLLWSRSGTPAAPSPDMQVPQMGEHMGQGMPSDQRPMQPPNRQASEGGYRAPPGSPGMLPSPAQAPMQQAPLRDTQAAAQTTAPTTNTAPATPVPRPAQALHVDPAQANADARVVHQADLPDDIKRELPPLVIGGAMHSDSAATRMLIVNSGVFHEGDQVVPGLVLQEIRLKSAVFKYKNYRYDVAY